MEALGSVTVDSYIAQGMKPEEAETKVREHYVYCSKLAEQAERFDEMCEWVKKVAYMKGAMKDEERSLLSVAYKNIVGSRRTAWRLLYSIEQRERSRKQEQRAGLCHIYKTVVEEELHKTCNEVLHLLDEQLPRAEDDVARVFLHKMKGDYYRYIAEFSEGTKRQEVAEFAEKCYEEATQIAEAELKCTDPIRLGLALNYSVFFYEIANKAEKACQMAQQAFNSALAELDSVEEEEYKDSTVIMQLLRDNMALWQVKDQEEEAGEDGAAAAAAAAAPAGTADASAAKEGAAPAASEVKAA